ncbi:TPA: hypothetical protein H2C15_004723 [Salmonella enterica]|nr:hypothetical protein [Salmonella enterica]
MRECGVTVSGEEKLTALARAYFADSRSTLDGLLLYIAWYGSGEGVVFERDRHDDVFGLMTVTFLSHLITGWGMPPVHARCFYSLARVRVKAE